MIIVVNPIQGKIEFNAFGNKGNKVSKWDFTSIASREKQAKELRIILSSLSGNEKIEALSLRIAFGGDTFNGPAVINEELLKKLVSYAPASPLYIPAVSKVVKLFIEEIKDIPMYAFFETSLFSGLPQREKIYPIASQHYNLRNGIKRGFHGIYHGENAGLAQGGEKIISVVLDKQTTVCAVQNKIPHSISIGYTPLEGIMSDKSCGDIDPGIAVYLMKEQGFSIYKLDEILKNESGFYGLTGRKMTADKLVSMYGKDEKVTLAFNVYKNQIIKYIGDSIAVMHGFDKIIFAGSYARALEAIIYGILKEIDFLGITLGSMPWSFKEKITKITSDYSSKHAYINTQSDMEIICKNSRSL